MRSIVWRKGRWWSMAILVSGLSLAVSETRLRAQAALHASGGVLPPSEPQQTVEELAARAARGAWDTFSTTMTIRRRMVAADGSAVGPAPVTERYRWARTKTSTGWKSITTVTPAAGPTVRTSTGTTTIERPVTVARMEDAEDGSAPRLWDSRGNEVALPPATIRDRTEGESPLAALRAAVPGVSRPTHAVGRGWIDGFVMTAKGRSDRRQFFERHYGRPKGVAAGLQRYVRREGEVEHEALVDHREGVIVAANVAERGALVEHSTFTYQRSASGTIVKRGLRLERLASPEDGTRLVTEIEYSDIRLSEGGAR